MFACVTTGLATPGVLSGSGYKAAGPAFCGAGASIFARTSGGAVGIGRAGFGRAQPATRARNATAIVSLIVHPPKASWDGHRCGLGGTVVPLGRARGQEACAPPGSGRGATHEERRT